MCSRGRSGCGTLPGRAPANARWVDHPRCSSPSQFSLPRRRGGAGISCGPPAPPPGGMRKATPRCHPQRPREATTLLEIASCLAQRGGATAPPPSVRNERGRFSAEQRRILACATQCSCVRGAAGSLRQSLSISQRSMRRSIAPGRPRGLRRVLAIDGFDGRSGPQDTSLDQMTARAAVRFGPRARRVTISPVAPARDRRCPSPRHVPRHGLDFLPSGMRSSKRID